MKVKTEDWNTWTIRNEGFCNPWNLLENSYVPPHPSNSSFFAINHEREEKSMKHKRKETWPSTNKWLGSHQLFDQSKCQRLWLWGNCLLAKLLNIWFVVWQAKLCHVSMLWEVYKTFFLPGDFLNGIVVKISTSPQYPKLQLSISHPETLYSYLQWDI